MAEDRAAMEEIAEDEEEQGREQDETKQLFNKILQGAAIASCVFAILGIIFSGNRTVTVIAAIIAVPVGALVVKRQNELGDMDSLRRVQNELREDVNRFQGENDKLSEEVAGLETQVDRVKATEEKLSKIAEENGSNVSSLVSLVKENGEVQDEMMVILKSETLQNMAKILLTVDRNSDYQIEERETFELVMRMKIDPRVSINEDNLKKKLEAHGGSISIRDLSKELIMAHGGGDEDASDDIFVFHPEIEVD